MDELELRDYIAIVRRRMKYFIIVALSIFLLSVFYALGWSNYRSMATIEIAPSEIASSTTATTGMNANMDNDSLADLRISHLQQKVMATSSLIDVITKFNLYPQARKNTPIAEVAEKMFKKIKLELVSSTLANPSAAQKASPNQLSAIAFTLSFDYANPLTAQQVTNELVSRFLDEDLKDRRNSAHETSMFVDAQIKVLETSMDEQEKKIAEFRAANGGIQPESLVFNQQAAESLMLNIQNIDAQLTTNEGTQGTLRSQIATIDPYSRVVADGQVLTTPTIQLKALKTQYATLSAQYGPEHPDVVKLQHQIAALQMQTGHQNAETAQLKARIDDVRTNLDAAQKTYGPDHPDVVALKRQLDYLQSQMAKAGSGTAQDNITSDADNPAYLQVVAELKSSEEQHKSLMTQKNALLAQEAKYQNAVAANPMAEQKLSALTRDYENSQLRYRELKEKKMAADMSETIELDRSGQRLVIINPPELPLHTQPSRMLFVAGGFILAILGGLAAVIGAQIISQSIVGPHHLESLVGAPPLVTIPYIATFAEINSTERKKIKSASLAVIAVIFVIAIFSYAVMPLDVLWAVVTQKFGR